jgi:hypothetical protein
VATCEAITYDYGSPSYLVIAGSSYDDEFFIRILKLRVFASATENFQILIIMKRKDKAIAVTCVNTLVSNSLGKVCSEDMIQTISNQK